MLSCENFVRVEVQVMEVLIVRALLVIYLQAQYLLE